MSVLRRRVAVVTGAAEGGIGEGVATLLAETGTSVVVSDIDVGKGRRTEEKLKSAGHDVHFVPVDICDPASAEELARACVERYGRIDHLVNNAALFGGMARGGLIDMEWEVLRRQFDVNLFGGLVVSRAIVPRMIEGGGGSIVFTSSTAAWLGGGHYGVAKAGVNALVLSLARELGPRNIRVNAVAPGMTDTPAMQSEVRPAWRDARLAGLAIPRLDTARDQAEAIGFLLSERASFVTGQIIAVDGGSLFSRL